MSAQPQSTKSNLKSEVVAPVNRKLSTKSTLTAFQYHAILEKVRISPTHTFEFRRMGIAHPSQRIKELRDWYGYSFDTKLISVVDENGYAHKNVARYTLISEPDSAAGGVKNGS